MRPCKDCGPEVELITVGYVNSNSAAMNVMAVTGRSGAVTKEFPIGSIRRLAIRLGGAVAVMSMPCAGVTQFIVATAKSAALEGPTSVDGPRLVQSHANCATVVGARYRDRVSFTRSGTTRTRANCSTPSMPPRTSHW